MRRALIACIHGNLVAIEAVLKDIALESVDEIVCLGDMVGFGPDVIECVDLVRERCAWSLCGDYDARLFMSTPTDLNHTFQKSLLRERKVLEPGWSSGLRARARWKWLEKLEPRKTDRDALFVHGSCRDPLMEFLSSEDFDLTLGASIKSREVFEFAESVCFGAHSHRPGVVPQGKEWQRPETLDNSRATLDPSVKYIVNVGSVGQPRDRDARSCYVVWDDEERTVTFHRVPYDLVATKKRFDRVPELGARCFDRLVSGV